MSSVYSFSTPEEPHWIELINWIALVHFIVENLSIMAIMLTFPLRMLLNQRFTRKIVIALFLVLFLFIRVMYIPFVLNFLPHSVLVPMSYYMVEQYIYAILLSYAIFAAIPFFSSLKFLFDQQIWVKKRSNMDMAPKVSIIMVIENQSIGTILSTVDSILKSDYGGDTSLYCSFNTLHSTPTFLALIRKFNYSNTSNIPSTIIVNSNEKELIISRFEHSNKPTIQTNTWELIRNRTHKCDRSNHYIVLVNRDLILDRNAINNLSAKLKDNPALNLLTGFVICKDLYWWNIPHQSTYIKYLQNEFGLNPCYVKHNCDLVMIKYKSLKRIGKKFFNDMCTAECKPSVCLTACATSLVIQKPMNEIEELCDVLKTCYSLAFIYKTLQLSTRYLHICTILLFLYFVSGYQNKIALFLFFLSHGFLKWLMMTLYCLKYKMWKIIFLYPLFLMISSFTDVYNSILDFYLIFKHKSKKDEIKNCDASQLGVAIIIDDYTRSSIDERTYRAYESLDYLDITGNSHLSYSNNSILNYGSSYSNSPYGSEADEGEYEIELKAYKKNSLQRQKLVGSRNKSC